ncbi:hypothetical protein EYF80_039394 [Liparis tanakae]|uniref:Uncharacterized protein n=1 Tax=Liparis tanakae TaxID=230148 RepID=A0A4Z2GA19_9TELE|nr:hypothetical protein EYF80_039394 [Liparis tanakae]
MTEDILSTPSVKRGLPRTISDTPSGAFMSRPQKSSSMLTPRAFDQSLEHRVSPLNLSLKAIIIIIIIIRRATEEI